MLIQALQSAAEVPNIRNISYIQPDIATYCHNTRSKTIPKPKLLCSEIVNFVLHSAPCHSNARKLRLEASVPCILALRQRTLDVRARCHAHLLAVHHLPRQHAPSTAR